MVGESRMLMAALPISMRESTPTPKVARPIQANAISDPPPPRTKMDANILILYIHYYRGMSNLDSIRSSFAAVPTDDIGKCLVGRAGF